MAIEWSGLAEEETVLYRSEVGMDKGKVVGRASADGNRGWRIDFDPTKGYHVNWWNKIDPAHRNTWIYGANIVKGGTYEDYINLLAHFQ